MNPLVELMNQNAWCSSCIIQILEKPEGDQKEQNVTVEV